MSQLKLDELFTSRAWTLKSSSFVIEPSYKPSLSYAKLGLGSARFQPCLGFVTYVPNSSKYTLVFSFGCPCYFVLGDFRDEK